MSERGKREAWLDALRVLAAFLVVVNHTNSRVFQALTPENAQWSLSVLWYYFSKTAVPIFVMLSGACLLRRRESYRRTGGRFLRVVLAALAAAYLYFLYDAWVNYGLWPRALRLDLAAAALWRGEVSDGFWYLPFYLGLLATLPLWQRMASAMEKKDVLYLMALTFAVGAGQPLLARYAPELALPEHFDLTVPCSYVGLLFAGHYAAVYWRPTRKTPWLAAGTLAACLALCLALTRLEYARVDPGEKYWFMDDRTAPALPVILAALAVAALFRSLFKGRQSGRALRELGGCAFAVYLLQDLLVAETRFRLFEPLCERLPSFAAGLCWTAAVFLLALGLAWIARRIPLLKRIL